MSEGSLEHHRRLERMYLDAPINRFFRPTIRVDEGVARIGITAREDFFHSAGAVHGSVSMKSLDDAAFFAVASLVEDVFVLTVSLQTYLLRPVSEGELVAEGTVVNRSSRLFVAEAVLRDDAGREVARGSGTFTKSRIPLSKAGGYGPAPDVES